MLNFLSRSRMIIPNNSSASVLSQHYLIPTQDKRSPVEYLAVSYLALAATFPFGKRGDLLPFKMH